MKLEIPNFKDRGELNKFLVENEHLLISQKKSMIKEADGFGTDTILLGRDLSIVEANKSSADLSNELLEKPALDVKAAINTSNVFDSHKDIHIPSLWDKSLKENKRGLHLQEHSRSFKSIIASGDDLKVYTETVSWKSLGYNYEGKTQVLMHDSHVRKNRNSFMHEQYAKGYVNNHSVGMQYVKILLAINDEDYPEHKEMWDKYIEYGINKGQAEEWGYFWAVTEAKYVEGSAVALGSNHLTPTTEVKGAEVQLSEAEKEALAIKSWLLGK